MCRSSVAPRARCRSRRVECADVTPRAQLAAAPCITAPTQREPTRRSLERAPPSRERVVGLDRAASAVCADHLSRLVRAAGAAAPSALSLPSSSAFAAAPHVLVPVHQGQHGDCESAAEPRASRPPESHRRLAFVWVGARECQQPGRVVDLGVALLPALVFRRWVNISVAFRNAFLSRAGSSLFGKRNPFLIATLTERIFFSSLREPPSPSFVTLPSSLFGVREVTLL